MKYLVPLGSAFVLLAVGSTSASAEPWTAVVCRNQSTADKVMLYAGTSRHDTELVATWERSKTVDQFTLPARVQTLPRIFVKLNMPDPGRVATVCVKHEGKTKETLEIDDPWETEHVHVNEDDHCPC